MLLVGGAAAQRAEWELPERAAVVYRTRVTESGKCPVALSVQEWAPVLLEGELSRERTGLARTPLVFMELVPYVAFDLRGLAGGRLRFEMPADSGMPALRVQADYRRGGEGASQTVLVAFEPTGRLRIDRTFDEERGIVDHFLARTEIGDWTRTEEWIFDRIEQHDSPRFRAEVERAIDEGAQHLLGRLARAPRRMASTYDPGHLALILFTLFKAGRNLSDPTVERAWEDLKARELTRTYDLACAILAMEALYTPPGERDRILSGDIDRPQARALPPADLAILEEWTDRLLENGDHEVDVAYIRRWRYRRNDGYDNSNTQYALLGLYAAMLCGADVSRTVWFAAIRHELEQLQDGDGDARRLEIKTHRELELDRANPRRTITVSRVVEPGGFGYVGRSEPTGSMTAAGVASLTICESALTRDGGMPGSVRQDVIVARARGLLWLADHLTVRFNSGNPRWRGRLHYYLYSLERACEFLQIAWLDGRDWYFEGAMQLLLTRNRDGAWSTLTDTCFAILFLKKAAYGPITGQR